MGFLQTLLYWTGVCYLGFLLAYGVEIFDGVEFEFSNLADFLLNFFDVIFAFLQLMLFFDVEGGIPIWLTIILNLAVNVPWILFFVGLVRGVAVT